MIIIFNEFIYQYYQLSVSLQQISFLQVQKTIKCEPPTVINYRQMESTSLEAHSEQSASLEEKDSASIVTKEPDHFTKSVSAVSVNSSCSKDTPITYNNRQDVKKNQISVHLFYVEVLNKFIEKLLSMQQRREKLFELTSEEDIMRLDAAIRYFYNQSQANYIKSLKRRHTNSQAHLYKISQITSTVIEALSFGKQGKQGSPHPEQNADIDRQSQLLMAGANLPLLNYPSIPDDKPTLPTLFSSPKQPQKPLFSFGTMPDFQKGDSQSTYDPKPAALLASASSIISEAPQLVEGSQTIESSIQVQLQPPPQNNAQVPPEPQKSQKEKEGGEEQNKNGEQQGSSSDSENSDEVNYAQMAEKQANCLFFGNFATTNIKRKPKQQKIYLQLHSVFLKFSDNGRDTFFDRASFQLKKAEKSQIPLEDQKER